MDLGAIGPAAPGTSLSNVVAGGAPAALANALAAGAAEVLGDSVAILLQDLSATDIAKLIEMIDRPLPAQDTARLQELVRTFLSAATEGDATRAAGALSKIAVLDPTRAETLRADPAMGSIRASVDQLLDRHITLAKLDAEGRLAQATQQANPALAERLAGWEMKPASMILIANRLFDSGGLANYVRAAELAQLVIDNSRWAPGSVNLAPPELVRPPLRGISRRGLPRSSGGIAARVRALWSRAPLLVLLLSWLLLGVTAGGASLLWRRFWPETLPGSVVAIAYEVWGTGFLALVTFAFFARLRKVRS